MPIYAYRCEACGHAQDVLQKLSDPLLSVCPACGEARYKKQLTAAGFQLKGSGWYVTDFRNGNTGAKPAAPEEGGKADAPKGDTATTDASKADAGKGAAPKAGSAKPDAAAKPGAPSAASPAAAPSAAPAPAARSAPPPAGP